MNERTRGFARWALWALPVWAVMLFLGTLTHQPDPKTDLAGFSAYVTTGEFLMSHLINSILGAGIGSVGVVALLLHLVDTRAAGRAAGAMVATVIGNTVTTSIFGAAAYAQPAIGRMFLGGNGDALKLYNDVYAAPLFGTAVLGLLLFIAGAVLAGIAIAASGSLPKWAGWVYAISATVFVLSNFLMPVGQSVAAAALILATVAVAWTGSRNRVATGAATPTGNAAPLA